MAELTETYIEKTSIARFDESELAANPQWLAKLRTGAMDRFGQTGFPTRRDEDWRVTPIAPIVETPLAIGKPAPIDCALLDGKLIAGAAQVMLVNGFYSAEHSSIDGLPHGVVIGSLADAIASGDPHVGSHLGRLAGFDKQQAFVALNTASIGDGLFVYIPRGVVVEQPIHIVYMALPGAAATVSHPRTLIVAGENSQATIVERFVGPQGAVYLTNAVTEISVADSAVIDHYKVQQESRKAFHVATLEVNLARASSFISHSFGFGGSIARNDANAALLGEGCTATLSGLFLAGDHQLVDNHTILDHAMPNCPSHQVYKHILGGHARGVFNGKIFVRLDAQKTDAKQTNQTLLLSPEAQIDTKPQLEIFADDVRCTHGATVGQLREDQLFYLQARGIGREQAKELLIYAFASAVIQQVKIEALRDELDQILLSERHIEGLG
jgi:Fe-S cluster assembly protein SufD